MRKSLCTATAFVGMTFCAIASAALPAFSDVHPVCGAPTERVIQAKVPIGCDVADPMFGCPPDAQLSLQITFKAPAEARVDLDFSNVSPEVLQRLVFEGPARQVDRSKFSVRAGKTTITGFTGAMDPAPMMEIALTGTEKWDRKLRRLRATDKPIATTLQIEQFIGSLPIAGVVTTHFYTPCLAHTSMQDRIALPSTASSKEAIALIDGKRAMEGCLVNERDFGKTAISLSNMVAPPGCATGSRATIFHPANAVEYVVNTEASPNAIKWTAASDDVLSSDPKALVAQPVKLWLLSNCPGTAERPCTTARTLATIGSISSTAIDTYSSYGGVTFDFLGLRNLIDENLSPADRQTVNNATGLDCTALDFAKSSLELLKKVAAIREPNPAAAASEPPFGNRLDVFFVSSAGSASGQWCGYGLDGYRHDDPTRTDDDVLRHAPNVILVVADEADVVLAHELGHALMNSGPHVNDPLEGDSAFPADNLMWSGASGKRLAIGQLFRASLDQQGSVNRHQVRIGETVTCSEFRSSAVCPRASCDVDRETTGPLALAPGEEAECALSPP